MCASVVGLVPTRPSFHTHCDAVTRVLKQVTYNALIQCQVPSPNPFFLSIGTISLWFSLATASASLFSAHVLLPLQSPDLSLPAEILVAPEEPLLQLALAIFPHLLPLVTGLPFSSEDF